MKFFMFAFWTVVSIWWAVNDKYDVAALGFAISTLYATNEDA